MTRIAKRITALALGTAFLCGLSIGPNTGITIETSEAQAERKNPLDGAPAVRGRLLLVKNRFEFTPAFESTINSDFRHTLSGGAKLEFHLSDLLSFGAVGFFGTSLDTGLTDKIVTTLPDTDPSPMNTDADPTPTKTEFNSHLNSMPLHGAVYVSVTPWYGKLAAFGKFFVNFDFYFQAGLSFATLKSDCSSSVCNDPNPEGNDTSDPVILPDNNPNDDPVLNDGFKPGIYLGGGIHVFLNDYLAIDLTVRDYIFEDNPSGLDFNADLAVTEADNRFLNHLFMGVGLSVMLPLKAKRTP